MFINRQAELSFLEEAWNSGPALIVLYGRRRVGKTELLRHFSATRRQIFFVATQSSRKEQLRSFARALQEGLGSEAAGVSFTDWESALEFLHSRSQTPILVVIDEFPYLVESEPALPSLLQAAWDTRLRRSHIRLVLCGSSLTMMERSALSQKSPLYGRRTGQFLLRPLRFPEIEGFFPDWTGEHLLQAYATLGGMPAYLLQFDASRDLWSNIEQRILRQGMFLRDEVPFLLSQELREPRLYMALLTAMAEGRTRVGDIAERALGPGQSTRAGFYLQTLQNLALVERRVPVTETMPHKSRLGIYRICDPFLRFWFRHVFPEQSRLESGHTRAVLEERIRPDFDSFCAPIFEEVCRDYIARSSGFSRVGSWWGAGQEIDLVALDSTGRRVMLGECKWSRNPVGEGVLADLKARGAGLAAQLGGEVTWALFGRTGFTPALKRRAGQEPLLLYSIDDLKGG